MIIMYSFLKKKPSSVWTKTYLKGKCRCQHRSHRYTRSERLEMISYPTVLSRSVGVLPKSANICSNMLLNDVLCCRTIGNSPKLLRHEKSFSNLHLSVGVIRHFHVGHCLRGGETAKSSSKVEDSVKVLKEKAKAKEAMPTKPFPDLPPPVVESRVKNIKNKIVEGMKHTYHGFRLLFIDINVSRKLLWKILRGNSLTRREHKLLVQTTADMFRLVPFSVFIIVPFMELLLPVFIKFFPGMLPSTFQTATDKEDKMKQSLKVKLEMAKFLQATLDDMAVSSGKGSKISSGAKEFQEFFENVRSRGGQTSSEDILKFSKLFQDEITLDSLPRPQLLALCRSLELQPFGTNNFLRFQLRMKLRVLIADDVMIKKEGLETLSLQELQAACRARGMRAIGLPVERLRSQLNQWLDLSLNEKVPPSLLLLSQAFMFPEAATTAQKLAATISSLPEAVATQTKAVIAEREGKVDNKTKIEVIKEEVAKIKEEHIEQQEAESERLAKELKAEDKELLVDKAPILDAVKEQPLIGPELIQAVPPSPKTRPPDLVAKPVTEVLAEEPLSTQDLEVLGDAISSVAKDKNELLVEKETLVELKEEMADYKEDIQDLQQVTAKGDPSVPAEVVESVAANRLSKMVDKMISNLDDVVTNLEATKNKELISEEEVKPTARAELLRIDELVAAIRKLQTVPDEARLERISQVLSRIDEDSDGQVRVEDVLKVLELLGRENVQLSQKQVDDLIALIAKEAAIELEDQIEKALEKTTATDTDEAAAKKPLPLKKSTDSSTKHV